MGLDTIIRNAVATANNATRALQADVTIAPWTGQDGYGAPTYGAPVSVKALVDIRQHERQTSGGQMVLVRATVTILEKLSRAIDTRDKVTLPDGTTGPIVDTAGMVDPSTTRPYFPEIYIGVGVARG